MRIELLFPWKKYLCLRFLVLPVTLLKEENFEKEPFLPSKCFRPSFLVISSNTNLREQFSTDHNVSWPFLPNFSVLLYKTYEFAEKGSKEYRFPRENFFTPIFSRIIVYVDLDKQFLRPKRDSTIYCASYEII